MLLYSKDSWSLKEIEENIENFMTLSLNPKMPFDFLLKHADKVSLFQAKRSDYISKQDREYITIHKRRIMEDHLCELMNRQDWREISTQDYLSESFIRKHADKLNWNRLSWCYTQHTEDFMREYQDFFNWENVASGQVLSEDFIREFKDRLCWIHVCQHQRLSEDFIREMESYVVFECIVKHQIISPEFEKELREKPEYGQQKSIGTTFL